VWPRCDAECSPERGFYYHPSRHSAGQPIVAGWAYQFIAQLNFVRESWVAPMDVERLRPAQDANEVAAEQVKAFVRLSPEEGREVPLFVFDAGYDPVKLQQRLEGYPCQILVRLRVGRRFYADPSVAGPPIPAGRVVTGLSDPFKTAVHERCFGSKWGPALRDAHGGKRPRLDGVRRACGWYRVDQEVWQRSSSQTTRQTACRQSLRQQKVQRIVEGSRDQVPHS
jgi:hypothetical protein